MQPPFKLWNSKYWSERLLVAYTTLLEILCCGSYNNISETDSADDETSTILYENDCEVIETSPHYRDKV